MLSFYYESNGAFPISTELHRDGIHFKLSDIMATMGTLLKDGHIEDLAPGYSQIPVCAITGSGRVFYEQGGYQDDTTKFDKMVKWAKNNSILAWILIFFFVVSAVIGFAVSAITIYQAFGK